MSGESSSLKIVNRIKDCLQSLDIEVLEELHDKNSHSVLARVLFLTAVVHLRIGFAAGWPNNVLIVAELDVEIPVEQGDRIKDLLNRANTLPISVGALALGGKFVVYKVSTPMINNKVNVTNLTKLIEMMVIQSRYISNLIEFALSGDEDIGSITSRFIASVNQDNKNRENASKNIKPE